MDPLAMQLLALEVIYQHGGLKRTGIMATLVTHNLTYRKFQMRTPGLTAKRKPETQMDPLAMQLLALEVIYQHGGFHVPLVLPRIPKPENPDPNCLVISGFRVQGSGSRVQSLGFRVEG